jgi:hypothetical protein
MATFRFGLQSDAKMGGLNDSVEIICPMRKGKEGSFKDFSRPFHNLKYSSALNNAFF